jgi:hypothetical protein
MLRLAGTTRNQDLKAADSPTARRVTSTTTSSEPVFLSVILFEAGAFSTTLAGETASAIGAGGATSSIVSGRLR